MKKLTVITINYNNKWGLKDTLESVFEQTCQDFEYILIDGGSTDGSKELLQYYDNKFTYWISERDTGIFNAMNKGLKQATGEYIIHMNSGDTFYAKNILEKVIPKLESGEDILCGNSFFVNDHNSESPYFWIAPQQVSFNFFCKDTLNHQSMFIKRSLFERVGFYSETYKAASDWIFLLQAFSFHDATYKKLDFCVSKYDRSGFSSVNWEVGFKEQQEVFQKQFSFFYFDFSGKDLDFTYPFWSNMKRNIKKLLKILLPYGVVRYLELYKAQRRMKKVGLNSK